MRYITSLLMLITASSVTASDLSKVFTSRHDPNSEYFIDYDDIDYVLRGSVIPMGRSEHKGMWRKTKITGTRLQAGNILPTRLEGNRFIFDKVGKDEVAALEYLRDDLLTVPSGIPLRLLSKREQLAYWLNLHTFIVLAKIADEYPITRIDPLFDYDDPDAFVNQRQFEILGEKISLADIQDHVTSNWEDPVVIYGFYMGAIGTPNLRNNAYTGKDVYDQLRSNAVDFVNSMRGTRIWGGYRLKVAEYYNTMAHMFPNFDYALLTHIRQYAEPKLEQRLVAVSEISPVINDWHIADQYNGKFVRPGGIYARINTDAELTSFKLRIPFHVRQLLQDRRTRLTKKGRQGDVTVEEVLEIDSEK